MMKSNKKTFMYAVLFLATFFHEGCAADDYSTLEKIYNSDPESMNKYIDDFVKHPDNRTLEELEIILKRLASEQAMPQNNPSYLGGVKQFFSKKNERDRFYDIFDVKQSDRSKWVGALNKELHTLKQMPSLLQDLDQKINTSSNLTLSSVLEIIKEYKEWVKEYTSSQEKVKKMIAAAGVKGDEPLFSPPQSTVLEAESFDQLDVYEKLFSTFNILLEGVSKIKIPALSQVEDPCDYFSTVTEVVDRLATVVASYHSPNNPFMRALSSQEKKKIDSSLKRSMNFVNKIVEGHILDYYNQKVSEYRTNQGSAYPMDQWATLEPDISQRHTDQRIAHGQVNYASPQEQRFAYSYYDHS